MQIKKRRTWLVVVSVIVVLLVSLVTAGYLWYGEQLSPYDASDKETVRVKIDSGMSGAQIATKLEENKLIKSALAMNLYMRLNGSGGGFQVGVYSVSPSQSLEEIIAHLTSGKADEMSVTFYPGAMLERADRNSGGAKYDVFTALKAAGFSDQDIKSALADSYTGAVFSGRPAGMGLEGYIYGDTYFVGAGSTARQVLQRAIDELSQIVIKHDFERKFAARGLTLYEGITLASIVERESIGCPGKAVCEDQRQIASVFYNRLENGTPLGSDVTYHYAADKDGVARNYMLDSPYNTRIHAGLPPGPIAAPGLSSLNAVADPATTNYMYFLSGDDDVTYFGVTEADHSANIRQHCQAKCLLP